MNKYTKKISIENFSLLEDFFDEHDLNLNSFKYDINKINETLKKYDFPQNFNFLEQQNITANVKNQQRCGCCWSHAVTSALAYRFKLKGLDLDLSPQDGLSCYLRDCDMGNYLIDPQLNLIKNGTVTEQCLPFSSGDGKITTECPKDKCPDGSDAKRYYSQNAYLTEGTVTQENYYDIVTLIIDQLIYKGPVVAGISIYQDFYDIHKKPGQCTNNTIYTYDEKSNYVGGHAVVIVGYGFLNNKFYWQIQNSWGPNVCDKGFVKIEFGQIGIENVCFGDAYLSEEGKQPYEIKLKYKKMDENCNIELSLENSIDIEKWENSLEISFESEDGKTNFNYQCGILSSNKVNKKLACYHEYFYRYIKAENDYKYKGFQSLGKDNIFNFSSSISEIKDFHYYGFDFIGAGLTNEQIIYVSNEESKIVLYFNEIDTWKKYLPPIYQNVNSTKSLSKCQRKILSSDITQNQNLIICELTKEEFDLFDYYNAGTKKDMVYDVLCGAKEGTSVYVYKLDKNKHPIFNIKSVSMEQTEKISADTILSLETIINGTISEDFKPQNFVGYSLIEYNNKNSTVLYLCNTKIPDKKTSTHNMICSFVIDKKKGELNYNNIYVLPYILPYMPTYPFEVILKDEIKVEKKITPVNSSSNIKLSLFSLFVIALLI